MEFVQSEKRLSAVQKDGATLRQHYEMAERAGRKCPELAQPEVPKRLWYLWRWFCELSAGRQHNGMSLNPLAWTEIQAWAQLTRRTPTEWEIMTLRAIDIGYLI